MPYRVDVEPVERALRRFDRPNRERIVRSLVNLANDPRPFGAEKLAGADRLWRIRVGDYRIVYEIHDDRLLVLIVRVAHRRDVYRRLP